MWKDSFKNIVVTFQTTISRIVGNYVRCSAPDSIFWWNMSPRGNVIANEQEKEENHMYIKWHQSTFNIWEKEI